MIKCENACPRGKFDGCCHKCPDFHTCPDSCQENPNACGSATFDEETALQEFKNTQLATLNAIASLTAHKKAIEEQEKEMKAKLYEAMVKFGVDNSFISITDEKSSDFSSNQTIRVLDQIANDIAVLFGKKYLGKVPNDAAGRISLWNDIVKHHTELQDIRAIENFSGENVTVEKGDTKKSVVVTDYVTPVNAMEQLYMTVYVQ